MENLFVVKNIPDESGNKDWEGKPAEYKIDIMEALKQSYELSDEDKNQCIDQLENFIKNPVYKNFRFAYRYCVFSKKDCGHVEILQTHSLEHLEEHHKGECTRCFLCLKA